MDKGSSIYLGFLNPFPYFLFEFFITSFIFAESIVNLTVKNNGLNIVFL